MKKITKYILIVFSLFFIVFSCKEKNPVQPPEEEPDGINVIYPNGGELFKSGDTVIVKWTSSTLTYPYRVYYKNRNNNWVVIKTWVPDTFAVWVTPSINLENTEIKVEQVNNAKILFSDHSDSSFSIINQDLVILSPDSTLIVTDSLSIQWESVGIEKVNIYYSIDSGNNWELLQSQYDASLGMFKCATPNISTSGAKIMLTFQSIVDDTEIQIVSDDFRIASKEEVNEALMLFPLHLGDVWVYNVNVNSYWYDPYSYFMKCELIDTTYSNGIKLYKNKCSYTISSNQIISPHPIGMKTWMGVDSSNAVVKTLPEFSLLMKLGDSIELSNNACQEVYVSGVGEEFIFNENREYKLFDTYCQWLTKGYKYASGIGIVSGSVVNDGTRGDFQLLGCVINNTVYGDTTFVY